MNLSSLFPPNIIAKLLDDLGAVADAARRLPELEREVLMRVDTMQSELTATRQSIEPLSSQLAALDLRLQPIEELPRVRAGVEGLQEQMAPIQELPKVREAVEPLSGQIEQLNEKVTPIRDIEEVRKGIEPLDEDMRAVRNSVDDLEPLMREVIGQLERLRADLGPLGELADKIPGIG